MGQLTGLYGFFTYKRGLRTYTHVFPPGEMINRLDLRAMKNETEEEEERKLWWRCVCWGRGYKERDVCYCANPGRVGVVRSTKRFVNEMVVS